MAQHTILLLGLTLAVSRLAAQDAVVVADSLPPSVANADNNFVALSAWARAHGAPTFAAFAVSDTITPPHPVAPVLVTRGQRIYRTMIRTGAANGPNFAGHFTVVAWGCGSPCLMVAIVDARTGCVYMDTNSYALKPMFRRDSRLLVSDPTSFMEDSVGHPMFPYVQYFEWTGTRLRLVKQLDASGVRLAQQPSN